MSSMSQKHHCIDSRDAANETKIKEVTVTFLELTRAETTGKSDNTTKDSPANVP